MDDTLNEQNCAERINSYTQEDWQPLFKLIPEIEKTTSFCKRTQGSNEHTIQIPYCEPAPIVLRFLKVVYSIPIIISFDWSSWNEGRKIASDPDFNFDSVDLVTKCKLITAIVRNDRFCEGSLVAAFESGLILKILRSIQKEVKCKK